jgi:DNA helicase-4
VLINKIVLYLKESFLTQDWSDSSFKPDFTLSNDLYIEHWCYDANSPEIYQINKKKYLEYRKWKEEQFKKHNKTLISLEEREMLDWQKLQVRIKELIEKHTSQKVQLKETFEILQLTELNKKSYEKFIDDIQEIINLAKSRFLTPKEVQELAVSSSKQKVTDFYKVLVPVFEAYNRVLKQSGVGYKDFNDLIKDAVDLLEKDKKMREYYQERLKYVLIDEFQDVSFGEIALLKSLITDQTNLFVVGDDWQSIYGWRGSDVNYILNFEAEFGASERIILPINYRSKKVIVDASSHFIQLTQHLTKKNISPSPENSKDSTKIVQVNAENDFSGAKYVVHKIKSMMYKDPKLKISDFLILYRSSRNLKGYNDIFKQADIKVQKHTIHWSKGTEFRYVFILGLKAGMYGFPNTYVDREIKRVIVDKSIQEKEDEERRVMYVAMTRAKEKLFLISERFNESEYAKDIPQEYKFIYQQDVPDSEASK